MQGWLIGVTVLDSRSPWHKQVVHLLFEHGKISQVLPEEESPPNLASLPSWQAKGWYLSPAFVDLHTQLADPYNPQVPLWEAVAEDAYLGGFGALLCHPSAGMTWDSVELIRAAKARTVGLPVSIYLAGAITMGLKGKELAELFEMHTEGVQVYSDGILPVQDAALTLRALHYLRPWNGLLCQVPVLQNLVGNGIVNESAATVAFGLPTQPSLAEVSYVAQQAQLAAYTGGSVHLSPITMEGSLEVIKRSRSVGINISCSTSIIYVLLNDDKVGSYNANYKLSPPLRSVSDSKALAQALAGGIIDALATHHVPVGLEGKQVEFEYATVGAPQLKSFFAAACTALVHRGTLELAQLLQLLTYGPADLAGISVAPVQLGQAGPYVVVNPTRPFIQEGRSSTAAGLNVYQEVQLLGEVLPIEKILP